MQSFEVILPAGAMIVALLLLAWGVVRRSTRVTFRALVLLLLTAVVAIPLLLRVDAIAALLGLESAAAVALSMLVVWRGMRRYPMFGAVSTLLLGIAAETLLVRACLIPL